MEIRLTRHNEGGRHKEIQDTKSGFISCLSLFILLSLYLSLSASPFHIIYLTAETLKPLLVAQKRVQLFSLAAQWTLRFPCGLEFRNIYLYILHFLHIAYFEAHTANRIHNLFHASFICRLYILCEPGIYFIYIYSIYMCRREGSCSAVRTCTQCFAASYARVTCEFLHGLRLRRRCRTDIYTISRGSSGALANLIRLKRQIFVCLLPLARCVAVRANVVWNGAYTQYKAMR